MQGNYQLVSDLEKDKKYIDNFINSKIEPILAKDKKAIIKVEEYSNPRSLSANRLYWMWIDQIVDYNASSFKGWHEIDDKGNEHFVELPRQARKKAMHMWLKDKFLGWTKRIKMGSRIIEPQLKSTKNLSSSEMCFYMEKVDMFAASKGWLLKKPSSEYLDFLEKQEA